MKLVGLFTTTLEMTASSEAMLEFRWVWPRTMFSLTAVASSAVPSVNFRPGRSLNVTLLPSAAYFHDAARPGSTSPAASRVVMDAYTSPSACMSHPALEVTGSQEVGSSHSQFSVPLAPEALADVAEPPDPLVALPQAASAEIATMAAAAAALR